MSKSSQQPAVSGHQWRTRLTDYFSLLTLSLIAIRPILRSLPCSDDVAFHLLRLVQLDDLLRQGILFTRWAPAMAQGYGFPLFNFYAPLSYYAAELFSLLALGDLNLGLRLTFAFGLFASAVALYHLARDHFSRVAAIVAAVAYLYAPYQLYDVYFRGNLAESFAWWLMPLALLSVGRLGRSAHPTYAIATVVTYTAVLLTHNAFALLFTPVLLAYGLWQIFTNYRRQVANDHSTAPPPHRSLALLCLSLLLSLSLSAFFWLPALLDRTLVHSDRLLVPPIFVYWGNFITLGELLALPRAVHPDLMNPSIPRSLGVVQAAVGGIGGLSVIGYWLRKRRPHATANPTFPHTTLFFLLTCLTYTFLTTAPSQPLWETLPLLQYVQFPWRLIAIASLGLAMLCAAAVEMLLTWIIPSFLRTLIPLLIVAALILSALYWASPRHCGALETPTTADIIEFEQATATIGTTAKGEYLPRTVDYLPPEPYSQPFAELPEFATFHSQSRTPLHFSAEIATAQPFTLTANVFHYPGWEATLDGRPAPITPNAGDGRVTLPIPPGSHQVEIRFTQTPLRRSADILSAVSLLVLIACAVASGRWHVARYPLHPSPPFTIHHSSFILVGLALTFLAPFLARPALPDIEANGRAAIYQNGLVLLDYQLAARAMPADGRLPVTLHLKADRQPDGDYRTHLQLVDEAGRIWSGKETLRPRVFRAPYDTRTWPLDQFAEDMHLLTPLPGTPPGNYTVNLILFNRDTLVPAATDSGDLAVSLGRIQLTRPNAPAVPEPQYTADLDLGEVTLLGYSLDRAEAAPGDPFTLTLFWRADEAPTADHEFQLFLVGPPYPEAAGPIDYFDKFPLVTASFGASTWRAGEVWRGQHSFRLPATLKTADYTWVLRLCDGDRCRNDLERYDLGSLSVTAPNRSFAVPQLQQRLLTQFDAAGILLGANITPQPPNPAAPLQVDLYWRADEATDDSLRVFVQLLDESGRPVAQSDAEPAAWSRPTTSWLHDEVIADSHTLHLPADLPPGHYRLIAGLYNPATGQRSLTREGNDHTLIAEFTLPDD